MAADPIRREPQLDPKFVKLHRKNHQFTGIALKRKKRSTGQEGTRRSAGSARSKKAASKRKPSSPQRRPAKRTSSVPPITAHIYDASSRNDHGHVCEIDWAHELQASAYGAILPRVVTELATHARDSSRPSRFAECFFALLVRELNLPRACLRQVVEGRNELVFVDFDCRKAESEPRVFGLNSDKNIIVNAVESGIPIVDGDQTKNRDNPPASGEGALTRDDGSIFSFPYTDRLNTRWLFTSCVFGENDAFNRGVVAFLHCVFPVFCAHYNAIALRDVLQNHPEVAAHIDIQRNPELRNRILEIVSDLDYSLVFLATASIEPDTKTLESDPLFQHIMGNAGNSRSKDRLAAAMLLKIANESPTSSFVVIRNNDRLHFESRDGNPMQSCDAPSDWPSGLTVAVVPLEPNDREIACVWVESRKPINAKSLLSADKVANNLEADLRASSTQRGGDTGGVIAAEFFREELATACRSEVEPVFIEGPQGSGKLFFARAIHNALFARRGIPLRILSPFHEPRSSEEFNKLLSSPGGIVFYRIEEFSRQLQTEVLRLSDEPVLANGDRLKAKLIFVLPEQSPATINGEHPNSVLGIRQRLKFSCVEFRTRAICKDRKMLKKLIEGILKPDGILGQEGPTLAEKPFQILMNYNWPGNLPELKRVLRGMVRASKGIGQLDFEHLPKYLQNEVDLPDEDWELCEYCFKLRDVEGLALSLRKAETQASQDHPKKKGLKKEAIQANAAKHARYKLGLPYEDAMRRIQSKEDGDEAKKLKRKYWDETDSD